MKFLSCLILVVVLAGLGSATFGYGDIEDASTAVSFYTGNLTNLSEMGDVDVIGSTDGQVLTWDDATGMWIAEDAATVGDTNETTRFDALVDFDCPEGYLVIGVQLNGTVLCSANVGNSSFNQSLTDSLYADISITGDNSSFNQSLTDTLYADISVTGGNLSWNETYADTLYIPIGDEADLNVNSSDYWDTFDTANTTWFENIAGILSLKLTELTSYLETWFGTKDTDDLTEGSTNLYDNSSWNEIHADGLYAPINYGDDWNKTYADGLYAGIDTEENSSFNQSLTDSLYYSITNPNGFYNSSDFSIGDYFTSAQVLAFNYYNSSDFNIADYFTSAQVLGFNYYNSTDFSIGDYYTSSQIDGFNYYNLTDFDISDYYNSTQTDTAIETANTSVVNWVDTLFPRISELVGLLGNWSADKISYSTTDEADTYYYSITNPYGFYNRSDFNIDDYSTTTEIVAFGYYNSTDFVITDYFTKTQIENFGYYNSSDFSIDDYFTSAEILGFNYYNSSDFDIANYYNSSQIEGFNYYNSSDFDINDYATDVKVDSLGNFSAYVQPTHLSNFTDNLGDRGYTSNLNFTNDANYWNDTFATFNKTYADTLYVDVTGDDMTGNLSNTDYFNGQFNWTTTDEWSSFDGSTFDFNESNLEITYFLANSTQVVTGTGSGTLADIQTYNRTTYNVTETNSDYELIVNFTGITEFTTLLIRHKTDDDGGHIASIQIWDYGDSVWEGYGYLTEETTSQIKTLGVYDDDEHIQDGIVQVRFYQEGIGNSGHIHQFDWVGLSKGFGTPVGAEIDPLSLHRDGNTPLTGNWNQGTFNLTNTDSWFLGKVGWATIQDTPAYLLIADLVGLVGNWSADKGDYSTTAEAGALYYSITNPYGFYNSTNFSIGDYSTTAEVIAFGYYNSSDFVITDYFTKTQIENFGYYNSTDFSISDYYNSTQIDIFDYYNASDFDITDYFTSAQVLGFNYYNSTDFSISDYFTKTQIENFGYYNSSDFVIGDYYLASNPSGFYNSSDFSISDYFTSAQVLGFNYYNSTDFSIGDYSTTTEADLLYIAQSDEGNLNVNSSDYWDNLDSPLATWISTYNSTYDALVTDNSSWNETYADTLYRADSWDNFTGIPTATPSDEDTTHLSTADQIFDYIAGLVYATTTYVDDLISSVGNWSSDKGDYSTTAEAGALYSTIDEPLWTANQSSYSTTAEVIAFGYYNSSDFSIGDYYTSAETDTEIGNANTSMKNYVDSNPAGYSTEVGTVTSIATTAPISGGTITSTGTISLDTATPSDGDTAHASTADQIFDWAVGLFMQDLVDDTVPQLGGDLDTNGHDIGSTTDEIENIYVGDNTRIYFGDGQDASIYYNGTVLIIS